RAPTPTPAPAPAPVALSPLEALRAAADSMLGDPQFANARWGVLIVRPATGDTLYARDADRLFMPASNQKLLTGAAALATLGPDHTWRTAFVARGPVRDGVLLGDLAVVGGGDPTVSDKMRGDAMQPLLAVADSLKARGITRVAGRLLADGNAFPDAVHGFGWAWDDLDEPYSAGVDELFFNEGFGRVVIRGGARPGDSVAVRVAPSPGALPLQVAVTTVTPGVVGGGTTATRVVPRWDARAGRHVLEGVVSVNDSAVLTLAHRDPSAAYLAALGEALAARGITVTNARRAGADTLVPAAGGDTLLVLRSLPLRDVLPVFEKPSQNQIGEILLKTMGLARAGVGSADSGRRVMGRQLELWGVVPERDAVIRDGSGLSRHDYVTPRALVRVLDAMRRDPNFRLFYDALPVGGVDGTIGARMRGTPAAGNVRAKTGTLDKARALSGYVTTADGELLLFSFLCNNYTVPTRQVDRVADAMASRLATLRLAPPAATTPAGGAP
ncbi:D-alanyl-D-alanine carboxypeptidase/D-alanyl-D-alanine-endopeptidase, partial [Roseisolibacter sp. H3M3-2]|uniref:D-alanyl-D-alanine carboxypeptidase/D-alanyl-D-alanine endopeptidase n=1 Tax=Roseisolibacter sp. H3M3-2 TaxID=3031323 RepID=UPI0023DC8F2F